MLQDDLPVGGVKHGWKVVFKGIWALRDGVQDHIASKAHIDLLEYQGPFGDHQHGHFLHFVGSSLALALFFVCVFADHGHLSILITEVLFEANEVEVARHQQDSIASAISVNTPPQGLDKKLIPSLV